MILFTPASSEQSQLPNRRCVGEDAPSRSLCAWLRLTARPLIKALGNWLKTRLWLLHVQVIYVYVRVDLFTWDATPLHVRHAWRCVYGGSMCGWDIWLMYMWELTHSHETWLFYVWYKPQDACKAAARAGKQELGVRTHTHIHTHTHTHTHWRACTK